jgi:predicted permease
MLSTILLVLLMFAAGSLLTRIGIFDDTAADALNRFVVYVSLPAVVLHAVPQLRWDSSLLVLVIVPWATLLLGVAGCLLAARAFQLSRPVLGAMLLCVPLGNTSFLGLPLLSALLGSEAMRYGLLYDQAGSFLILSTYGLVAIARYSGETPPTAAVLAARVLTFPPFVALVLAVVIAAFGVAVPAALDDVLASVGETLVPVAMFAVGMRLRLRPPAERAALWSGLAIKMLLFPAVTFVALRAFGARDLAAQVAILESAMPPMLTAAALASVAGLAPELCAAFAGYGIVFAFMLVPLWAALCG